MSSIKELSMADLKAILDFLTEKLVDFNAKWIKKMSTTQPMNHMFFILRLEIKYIKSLKAD